MYNHLIAAEMMKVKEDIKKLDKMIKECQDLTLRNAELLAEIIYDDGVTKDDNK